MIFIELNMKNEEINKNKAQNILENNSEIGKCNSKDNNEYKYESEVLNLSPEFKDFDINFKIIVIGNSGVGKTCITNQAVKNIFINNYQATIGMEIYTLFLRINKKIIQFQIWDTCGEETYRSLVTNFYRNTSLAILVYSIDQRDSFRELDLWIKELRLNNSPDTKLVLVGNKLDLENIRQIQFDEGKQLADDYGFADFFETSAKTGENITKMFLKIGNILYDEYIKYSKDSNKKYNTFKEDKYQLRRKTKGKSKKHCC